MGLAGVPALMLTLGSLIVVDTPNSLIQRGKLEEGKSVLRKIRGTENIEAEFFEIVEASKEASEIKHPFRNLLKRKNRPPLIIAIAMQVSFGFSLLHHSHFRILVSNLINISVTVTILLESLNLFAKI